MSETKEDRTEAASPRRLENARDEGDVPLSRELPILAGLFAGLAVIAVQVPGDPAAFSVWLSNAFRNAGGDGQLGLSTGMRAVFGAALPVATAAMSASAAAVLLQTSFLIRSEALQPDLGRVSPLKGIKRLFGIETVGTAAKAVAKLAVLIACLWFAMARVIPLLPATAFWQPGQLYRQLARSSAALVMLLLGAQGAIAMVDLLLVRFRYARRMRMSRHEQREEHKTTEGNPQVKQRLRQITRSRARRRMMSAVPRAAVVVTNPTHYAVALAYERGGKSAPRVVAKGADEIAARIREVAREHRIPLVANPPLAQALYRVDIDTEIPVEHFRAVAEVIAYVWRLRSRRARL
jgi:flagellar biosynthetic protein FlhB